jgi:hypothetical protein
MKSTNRDRSLYTTMAPDNHSADTFLFESKCRRFPIGNHFSFAKDYNLFACSDCKLPRKELSSRTPARSRTG